MVGLFIPRKLVNSTIWVLFFSRDQLNTYQHTIGPVFSPVLNFKSQKNTVFMSQCARVRGEKDVICPTLRQLLVQYERRTFGMQSPTYHTPLISPLLSSLLSPCTNFSTQMLCSQPHRYFCYSLNTPSSFLPQAFAPAILSGLPILQNFASLLCPGSNTTSSEKPSPTTSRLK